jgi:F-type H+-transporting ATPase subunit a
MKLIESISRLFYGSSGFVGPFASSEGVPELPNWITILNHYFQENVVVHFLHQWEGMAFAYLIAAFIVVVVHYVTKNAAMIPGRLQSVVEMAVEGITNLLIGILGPQGKAYVPFLGTLFFYILCMNLSGTLPLSKSPTASANTTVALALCVFVYVHYIGVRKNGALGYVKHLMGSPKSGVEWAFVPIMLPVHILGEIARPVSLSLRLFGNVTGEDVLLYAFTSLGVAALAFMHSPIGIPFQVPFMFLAFLTSFIQALVFTLLSTIYILLMLPHDHVEEGAH